MKLKVPPPLRTHFAAVRSGLERLGAVATRMGEVEQLFSPAVCVGGAESRPAIAQSLRYLRAELDACVGEWTAWRDRTLAAPGPGTRRPRTTGTQPSTTPHPFTHIPRASSSVPSRVSLY